MPTALTSNVYSIGNTVPVQIAVADTTRQYLNISSGGLFIGGDSSLIGSNGFFISGNFVLTGPICQSDIYALNPAGGSIRTLSINVV